MKNILTILLVCFAVNASASTLDTLDYTCQGKAFRGYVAKPAVTNNNTKTILIVHEWWGLNEYPKSRAIQLASEGFIAICIDMYGAGITANDPMGASELAGIVYRDSGLLFSRFMAGYNAAIGVKGVNKEKMAAIGYCFGGTVVLTAAKMGADLDAIVSFHGGLSGPYITKGKMKTAVLVCNGAADKFVPQQDIDSLAKDMKANNIDYTFINYPNATHAFTNKQSTAMGLKYNMPIAYNEAADKKSYKDFLAFIAIKVH